MTNTWTFLLVLVVMSLTTIGGLAQHRYYSRTVGRLAREYNEPGYVLVSGRGKGRLGGAIAILVLRKEDKVIRAASVMEGATVLTRFKERSDWVGLSVDDDLPQCSPRLAKAVAEARTQVPGRRRLAPRPGAGLRGAPGSAKANSGFLRWTKDAQ